MITYRAPEGQARDIILAIATLIRIFFGWSAVTLEVFFRRPGTLGQQHYNVLRFIMGIAAIKIISLPLGFWILLNATPPSTRLLSFLTFAYPLAYIGVGFYHLYQMGQQAKQGLTWPPRAIGQSWIERLREMPPIRVHTFIFTIDDATVWRFIEPALVFLPAFILMPNGALRLWLMWSALSLFIHNNMIWQMHHQDATDQVNVLMDTSQQDHQLGQDETEDDTDLPQAAKATTKNLA